MSEDLKGKNIPDSPLDGDERIELRDDDGKLIGIADIGIGNPDNPYRNQLLSVEDELRLDEKGRPVVQKAPWSHVPTGLYFTIAAAQGPLNAIRPAYSGTSFSIAPKITSGADARLFVGTFRDHRPVFGVPTFGAYIELPSDLGQDEIKRRYLTEWIAHTTVEALAGIGVPFNMNDPNLGDDFRNLALMATFAAEDAIRDAGL